MSTLANLGELVVAGNESGVVEAVNAMVADKADSSCDYQRRIIKRHERCRRKIQKRRNVCPEVLMAARA